MKLSREVAKRRWKERSDEVRLWKATTEVRQRPDGMCSVCGLRPGTEKWVGENGVMGLIHGMWTMRCAICVLEEQIQYAKRQAEALPKMEAQLKALYAKEK